MDRGPCSIQPPTGPPTSLKILQAVNPDAKGKTVDLAEACTDAAVRAVTK